MENQSKNPSNEIPIENMTYEQALNLLEETVAALETGEHPLDHALYLFERGQALAKHCSTLLDQAQLKVKKISGEELADFPIDLK
jgi:exodeoxyribonuclease VII small subunit